MHKFLCILMRFYFSPALILRLDLLIYNKCAFFLILWKSLFDKGFQGICPVFCKTKIISRFGFGTIVVSIRTSTTTVIV